MKHSVNSKGKLQSYLTCGCVNISLVVLVATESTVAHVIRVALTRPGPAPHHYYVHNQLHSQPRQSRGAEREEES